MARPGSRWHFKRSKYNRDLIFIFSTTKGLKLYKYMYLSLFFIGNVKGNVFKNIFKKN